MYGGPLGSSSSGPLAPSPPTRVHVLAGNLIDRVLASKSVAVGQLRLVAAGCLRVAAKHCEQEAHVPSLRTVVAICPERPRERSVAHMEVSILTMLGWEIFCNTAFDFLGRHCLMKLILPGDRIGDCMAEDLGGDASSFVAQYANFFVDLSAFEYSSSEHLPSRVAAASVAAARLVLAVNPVWPERLQLETGYEESDLCEIMYRLLECARLQLRAVAGPGLTQMGRLFHAAPLPRTSRRIGSASRTRCCCSRPRQSSLGGSARPTRPRAWRTCTRRPGDPTPWTSRAAERVCGHRSTCRATVTDCAARGRCAPARAPIPDLCEHRMRDRQVRAGGCRPSAALVTLLLPRRQGASRRVERRDFRERRRKTRF